MGEWIPWKCGGEGKIERKRNSTCTLISTSIEISHDLQRERNEPKLNKRNWYKLTRFNEIKKKSTESTIHQQVKTERGVGRGINNQRCYRKGERGRRGRILMVGILYFFRSGRH